MQVFPRNTPSARGQWVVLPVNVAHGDFPIPQNLASLAPSSGSAICDCRSYSTSSGESGNSSSERPGGKKRKTSTESTWSRLWNSHSNFGQIINISGSIQQTAAVVSFLWGKITLKPPWFFTTGHTIPMHLYLQPVLLQRVNITWDESVLSNAKKAADRMREKGSPPVF